MQSHLPLTKVEVKGTAYVGGECIGSLEGTLTHDAADLILTIPPEGQSSPTGKLLKGKVHLHLDAKEFTGDGRVTFLEALAATAQFVWQFNGNGSFVVTQGEKIGSLDVRASASGSFAPGFKHFKLDGALTLEVPLEMMTVTASLEVQADADRDPPVVVVVRALGHSITIELSSLAELNLKAIQDALNKKQKEFLGQLGKLFSDGVKDGEVLADRWGRELASSVSYYARKNGLDKPQTGISAIDKFGGQAAQVYKDVSGYASDKAKGAEAWVGKVTGFSLTDGGQGRTSGPAPRQARQTQLDRRLGPLVADLNRLVIFRSNLIPGAARKDSASELLLRLRHCVAAPEGKAGAVVAFSVEVSGFSHALDPRRPSRPVAVSDVQPGRIHIKGLYGKGKPVAEIDIPKVRHGSAWPADDLLRTAVSEIVMRRLPSASKEGRYEERTLTVQNLTGERLTVYVQTQSNVGPEDEPRWAWVPGGPGVSGKVMGFTIQAGKTTALDQPGTGGSVRGVAARIWAKSASGRIWDRHKKETIWLVDKFETDSGRHYYAPRMETFVYRFENSKVSKAEAASRRRAEAAVVEALRRKAEAATEAAARRRAEAAAAEALRRKAEAAAEAAAHRRVEAAAEVAAHRKTEEAARRRAEAAAEDAAKRRAEAVAEVAAKRRIEAAARRKVAAAAEAAARRRSKAATAAAAHARQQAVAAAIERQRAEQEIALRQEIARQQEDARRRAELERAELERAQQEIALREKIARQQEDARRRAEQEIALRQEIARQQEAARREAMRHTIVPDLRNMTYANARRTLMDAGLNGRITGDGRGRVVRQFPQPGTNMLRGSIVTVVFSSPSRR